jgi:hypothetical protein
VFLKEVNVIRPVLVPYPNDFFFVMFLMGQTNLYSIGEVHFLVKIDYIACEWVNSALSESLHALFEGLF